MNTTIILIICITAYKTLDRLLRHLEIKEQKNGN